MLRKRLKVILQKILDSQKGISGVDLATILNVSTRTIRSDINDINKTLVKLHTQIHSNSTKGYYIYNKDKEIVKNFLLSEKDEEIVLPNTPDERKIYLLFQLLFDNQNTTLNILSEKMYISKTTISSDLKKMSSLLQSNHLSLNISSLSGINIDGKESDKRLFLSKLIDSFYDSNLEYLNIIMKSFLIFNNDMFFNLYNIIVNVLNSKEIILTDKGIYTFTLDLLLCIFRTKNHFLLEPDYKPTNDELIALPFDDIEKLFQTPISNIDRSFINVCFSYKRVISYSTQNSINSETAEQIINTYIMKLKQDYHIDLDNNIILKSNLAQHIATMIKRIQYETNHNTELTKEVKISYPYAFELATTIIPIVKQFLNIDISEIEISYIAIHLAVILDTIQPKKNVLIICGSGLGTAQLIMNRVSNYFSTKINIVGTIPLYKLSQLLEDNKNIQLILSTVPISHNTNIPILQISPLFTSEDIETLSDYLNQPLHPQINDVREVKINNVNILNSNLFFIFEDDSDRQSMLQKMIFELYNQKYIQSFRSFYASVLEREKLYSTMYDSIWLPHPMKGMSSSTVLAVGIVKKPKTISLILLCAINAKETSIFQELYSKIVNTIDDEHLFRLINQTNNFYEFQEIFNSI